MKDIVSLNRHFLFIARERANSLPKISNHDVITGLPKAMLVRISKLSVDELEVLAQSQISLFSLRISEKQIDQLVSGVRDHKRPAYLIASLPTPSLP